MSISGTTPHRARIAGEIQLRTDRRLDLTGIPPAET